MQAPFLHLRWSDLHGHKRELILGPSFALAVIFSLVVLLVIFSGQQAAFDLLKAIPTLLKALPPLKW